jgi:hypothetical protein
MMLIVIALVVTILFFNLAISLQGYLALNAQTQGKVERFSVKKHKEDAYGIEAHYTYIVDGVSYQDHKVLTHPIFLNATSANMHLTRYWKEQDWSVWYNTKRPEVSALQKLFPIKKLISFLVSLGVLVYFFWFKRYATHRCSA